MPSLTWKPVSGARVTGRIKWGRPVCLKSIYHILIFRYENVVWTFVTCQGKPSESLEGRCPSGLMNCGKIPSDKIRFTA